MYTIADHKTAKPKQATKMTDSSTCILPRMIVNSATNQSSLQTLLCS
jgi:hypothetical protein